MEGKQVSVSSAHGTIKWKVVESVEDDDMTKVIEEELEVYEKGMDVIKGKYNYLSAAF